MASLDLSLLRSFVTVVEAGGFTAAEKRVHRTQSTISQQVRRLEEQLGAVLLLRGKAGVSPTAEGERVLAYARRMLALESEMGSVLAAGGRAVTLRLGMTDDFAQQYLPALLQRARSALPQVQLRVTCDLSVALRQGLAQGDFDLAVYKRTSREGAGTRILSEPMEWMAARGFQLAPAAPLPLLLFPRGCVYRQRALARLDTVQQAWNLVFESPSTVSVQAAVAAGLGIAILTPASTPRGCRPVAGLPKLGQAELVYEFGGEPGPEARLLRDELLALVDR